MDTLNLTLVQSFLAVMQTRSFQTAAKRLALAQPTISLHVQKLEDQLGTQLFHRSRVACAPTADALAFVPYAESLLRLNERALAAIKGQQTRIGASSNIGIYILQPFLKSFTDSRKGFHFDMVIDRNPVIADKLDCGEIDIALMEWWDKRKGFSAQPWRRDPVVVIVSPDHPWATRRQVDREELRVTDLLGGEPGTGTGRLLAHYFGTNADMPRSSFQLGSTEAVKQAVKAGMGISLVLRSAVEDEIKQGTLVAVPLTEPGLHKELWIIWRPDARHSPDIPPAFVQHLLAAEAFTQRPLE